MAELKFPTESITLPSKGLIYPESNPLSKGEIEMRYMRAADEDILTNTNFIKDGTVIDRLLKSLIVTKINYDDLIIGDKNAILVAARILGYGKYYDITYFDNDGNKKTGKVDLSTLKEKELDRSLFKQGVNNFEFDLPNTQNKITFKLLTHKDEKDIEKEIEGFKKINPNSSFEITTRLKKIITSINGDSTIGAINDFVDNSMVVSDSRALRKKYSDVSPDIELKYFPTDENYVGEGISFKADITFLWPDFTI